jgi:uncharacterized protein (TIGR03435 family)
MGRAIASLVVCAAGAVCGQTAIAQQFEVASVKPSKADPTSSNSSGIKTGHDRLDASNVTLKRCIMGAYGVGPHQILGGPDWLASDRFEITAKADRLINDDGVMMVMLQGLLAERFKLALHRETRMMPALVLEVGRNGPKIENAEDGDSKTNTSSGSGGVIIDVRCTGMDSFAKILAREMDLPVVNHTGLKGIFNFKLEWTPERAAGPENGRAMDGPSIFTAIQEQLGLRLRSEKTPVEILMIDHAERPSEN